MTILRNLYRLGNRSHFTYSTQKLVTNLNETLTVNNLPSYIHERQLIFDRIKKQYNEKIACEPRKYIQVTLPDGTTKLGATSWETTPLDIAKQISQSLAEKAIISNVNGTLWDLNRPLENDCTLNILKFDSPDGKYVFWHSSAHVLGEAMERVYGGYLCYGPPIDEGFYYDMYLHDSSISSKTFPVLEDICRKIISEKQTFERLEMCSEDLLEMFKYNPFKLRILEQKVKGPTVTVYRCGTLIDLCKGPHVIHTGKLKSFKIIKNSSSYWEGKSDAEPLQRVYGISFPEQKQLKEWEKVQEEALKRDHRKIGKEQQLYFFHEMSPGSCFFQPKGAYIYNTLVEFIRKKYREHGYQEVVTPNIFNAKLWETSGHWTHYGDNMFSFDVENSKFALKPMNCPGHCLIYDNGIKSWRDLPLRLADFGVLHRNELSGTLTGLTRVRRFQQDDGHIFCTIEQIKQEIKNALDFLQDVYGILGFSFDVVLSTRPEKYLGDLETWNIAEKALEESLNEFGLPWKLNPQDGAFYGPKIDITITDALLRSHQTATIQLDFQLPSRFNLSYVSETGEKKQPVIIHRAVIGSVERMIAILTESYAGKWPFWLSPRQAMVVPVAPLFDSYAKHVQKVVADAGFECELNIHGDTMNKKIRKAQLEQFNFILVVGHKEVNSCSVNVRTRNNVVHGEIVLEELLSKFKYLKENYNMDDGFI